MVGAGTYNPATILRALGPEPWNVAYVEPSFRPDDGRFADSPNRMQMHHQYQVVLKPIPTNCQELYLQSLFELGIKRDEHDIRFVEDNWESPALSAWGLGWEVWLDGMEVTQYTYFQQGGGIELDPPACELTYGLERLAMYLQGVTSVWDLMWDETTSYAEILKKQEIEFCEYDFNVADISRIQAMYDIYEKEAQHTIDAKLVAPALDYVLRCSHAFNILDARGAVGLSERVKIFGRMRDMTRAVAKLYVEQREALGHPLLNKSVPKVATAEVKPTVTKATTPQTFALEIGCEELAAFAPTMLSAQIKETLPALLKEARLSHGDVYLTETPRRLVVVVDKLDARQEDRTRRVKGPARSVCEKNPQVLEGFCKKQGVGVSTIVYEKEGNGEFAFISVEEEGRTTGEVLSTLIPELLGKLKIDSTMRWLSGVELGAEAKVSFNRPIRWIVALFGNEVINTRYAGVNSGTTSFAGRWDGSPSFAISNATELKAKIEAQGIVVDTASRRALIKKQVDAIASSVKGVARVSDSQLDEVTQLVEHPTAFLCSMEERFLHLPAEVLVSTVEKHVRCFCVFDAQGKLLPYFIGVRNGGEKHIEIVRGGFERLITARFNDANFFITRDTAQPLESFRENIKKLVFHAKVGSMFDKSERLEKLVGVLASKHLAGLKANSAALIRAAHLSKADLGTEMVVEMTSLQGDIGGIYAERNGENATVACAIKEQYLPKNAGGALPTSPEGIVLSIADRLDTIATLISVGVEPTGSADPFALRREAIGLLQILLQSKLNVSLRSMIGDVLVVAGKSADGALVEKILDFINKRFEIVLRAEGFRHDFVAAVLSRTDDNPYRAQSFIKELSEQLAETDAAKFEAAKMTVLAYLRCKNIVDAAEGKKIEVAANVDAKLFVDAEEGKLFDALSSLPKSGEVTSLGPIFKNLSTLQPHIDAYFAKVMVMSTDAKERGNRLAVVRHVAGLLGKYADLGKLEGFKG